MHFFPWIWLVPSYSEHLPPKRFTLLLSRHAEIQEPQEPVIHTVRTDNKWQFVLYVSQRARLATNVHHTLSTHCSAFLKVFVQWSHTYDGGCCKVVHTLRRPRRRLLLLFLLLRFCSRLAVGSHQIFGKVGIGWVAVVGVRLARWKLQQQQQVVDTLCLSLRVCEWSWCNSWTSGQVALKVNNGKHNSTD